MLLLDEQCMDLEDAGSVNNSTARFFMATLRRWFTYNRVLGHNRGNVGPGADG